MAAMRGWLAYKQVESLRSLKAGTGPPWLVSSGAIQGVC